MTWLKENWFKLGLYKKILTSFVYVAVVFLVGLVSTGYSFLILVLGFILLFYLEKKRIDSYVVQKPKLTLLISTLFTFIILGIGLNVQHEIGGYFTGLGALLAWALYWIPVPQYFAYHLAKDKNREVGNWIGFTVLFGFLALFFLISAEKLSPKKESPDSS